MPEPSQASGTFTVLWADQVAGLQALGRDGSRHDVAPADAALLVNLGDLMARLTDDRWLSTPHRVRPPIVRGTVKRRRSAAFFHDGRTPGRGMNHQASAVSATADGERDG